VALVLTRQKVPSLDRTLFASATGLARGAYVLSEARRTPPRAILMASGSEVGIALDAQGALEAMRIPTRVVSFPSHELFAAQPPAYCEDVLPAAVTCRVAIEAAHPMSWRRWVGDRGGVIGIERFGASAPYQKIYQELGLTAARVVEQVKDLLG
jgi:transketolase